MCGEGTTTKVETVHPQSLATLHKTIQNDEAVSRKRDPYSSVFCPLVVRKANHSMAVPTGLYLKKVYHETAVTGVCWIAHRLQSARGCR